MEDKRRERFKKVAYARRDKIREMLRLLGNCANRVNYSYSSGEVQAILDELEGDLQQVRSAFGIQPQNSYRLLFEQSYTYIEGFRRNVLRYGNKTAVIFPQSGESLTYRQLDGQANALGNALLADGLRRGSIVAAVMENAPAFVIAYIACEKIGAVFMPLNYRLAAGELAHLCEQSMPAVILTDAAHQGIVRAACGILKKQPSLVLCTAGEAAADFVDFRAYVQSGADMPPADRPGTMYDETVRLYTAGSGGTPRAVPILSVNEILSAHDVIMHLPLNCTDRTLSITPWFHRGGLAAVSSTLYAGGTVYGQGHYDAKRCLRMIEAEQLTYLICAPAVLGSLAAAQEREQRDLSSLSGIITMGQPLDRGACMYYQRVLSASLYNGYGTTETFWNSFLRPFDLPEEAGSAGIACVDDDVRIVRIYPDRMAEPEDMIPPGSGEVGEIIVHSPAKSSYRYANAPHTEHYYRGYLYTGDTGIWDERCYITVIGRRDHMINSLGENISPRQVEQILMQINGVRACAVTAVHCRGRGETVAAYIVRSGNPDVHSIDRACRESQALADYKRPRYYRFVEALPLKQDGSPDRQLLREMAQEDYIGGLLIRV